MGVRTDAGQASMVGRGSVLAICGMALRRARTGQGSLLLVTGEPGIGKTTLLLAAAAEAREQGCAVAWAACPEEDAAPAFWPLVQLLSGIAHPATRTARAELSGGAPATTSQNRFVLFDRVVTAIRHAAAERPLLLVLTTCIGPTPLRSDCWGSWSSRCAQILCWSWEATGTPRSKLVTHCWRCSPSPEPAGRR